MSAIDQSNIATVEMRVSNGSTAKMYDMQSVNPGLKSYGAIIEDNIIGVEAATHDEIHISIGVM
jgi:hypothetical protein